MEKVITINERYNGHYVALKNIDDNTVFGAGRDPQEALNQARKKGIENPLIIYVPEKDTINIYRI